MTTIDQLRPLTLFIPGDSCDGIPYEENIDWLEQFYPCRAQMESTGRRIIAIIGVNADYPYQIWSMKDNHYQAECHLEWDDLDEDLSDD